MLKEITISVLACMIFPATDTTANGSNNRPAIADTWQKIVMVYYHDFPCNKRCQRKSVSGCIRIRNKTAKWTLRCQEHITLLRSKAVIAIWQKMEQQKGYVSLSLPEISLKDTRAQIVAVRQIHKNYFPVDGNSAHIIGIFKRHIMSTNKYTFRNIKTRTVSLINVTPGHRFYVKNRKSFIPISQITPSDTLINSAGEKIKLTCPDKEKQHCNFSGESANADILPVQVYNLEVHKKYFYFAGTEKILVHNICALARELQDKLPGLVVTKGFFRWKRAYLKLNNFDDAKLAWMVLKRNYPESVECETCSSLVASAYTGKKLKIASLENFLCARGKFIKRRSSASAETYHAALNDLLKPFGERLRLTESSRPIYQQILGKDYHGAALVAGGKYIGFVRGEELDQYYSTSRPTELLLQEIRLSYHTLLLRDWGLDHNNTWRIDFFIPLKER